MTAASRSTQWSASLALRGASWSRGFTSGHGSGDNVGVAGPTSSDPLATRERLLASTYECVARFGIAKTTVEDVVRASGISRATIYRHFPGGRDELLLETVGWELAHYFTRLGDHVRDEPDLVHLVEAGLVFARRSLLEHELLQRILQTEPERLLGLLTTESAKTVPFIASFLLPYLQREQGAGRLRPELDLDRASEHLARMLLSLIGTPGRWRYDDPVELRTLVTEELLGPLLTGPPAE
jgi:AcrR family transcriptional regulator